MSGEPSQPNRHPTLILGIETSGLAGSIALCRGVECLAESRLEEAPRRHAQTLVSQIGQLMVQSGHSVRDLDSVAVSIGPGSFTGLRVGVVCAKTLAYATGCRLAAVDTLRAIAANSGSDVDDVSVMADALRGDIYAATYRRSDGVWATERPPEIVAALPWLVQRAPDEVISGPGLSVYASAVPAGCVQLPPAAWTPHARVIALLAVEQLARDETADCATLVPFYLRRSAAEERKSSAP
jgi:tRNA threonylcarbamoyladenosine biosynthesis protein TsaB